MRIVAGRHRGRRLLAPPGETVRPTSDRAREALFNILSHGQPAAEGIPFAGPAVLDAFAGTGALGLEALSRGAAEAAFVEQDREALAILRQNIAALGEEGRARIVPGDATRPPRAPSVYALAFLDPPYRSGLAAAALTALDAAGWLTPDALAVVELAAREHMAPPAGFNLVDERVYGATRLLFLRRETETAIATEKSPLEFSRSVNKIGPAFPGAKLPAVMMSRMWPMPAPIRKHASTKLVANRASKERNAAYNPAKPIPRLATPTSNWKGLVCHPIACATLAGKTMWPSAAHNPINPTGKMKAYRSKRSRRKARATGRGPLAIAIAALVRAATHDSTGTIETTRFCQDRATWPHIATRRLPAQDRRTLGDVSLNILGRL